MPQKYVFAVLAYLVPTFILGYTWHLVAFPELYHSFGMYNRTEPIIPLGLISMLVQGVVLAWVYPRFYRGGSPAFEGLLFGLLMGAFLFSVSTVANAAKIHVDPMGQFMAVQAAFHLLQFGLTGPLIGLAFGRTIPLAGDQSAPSPKK
jgi:hypothetical protein